LAGEIGMSSSTGKHRRIDTSQPTDDPGSRTNASTPKSEEASKRSGRVTFDSRGNSIWEWQTEEPGEFSSEVNTHYVKKLELPELSLEEDPQKKAVGKIERPQAEVENRRATGFNPYNSGTQPIDSTPPGSTEPPPVRKPIKDLRRYNEWMKLKQRMADKKDDSEEVDDTDKE
jgi:hypothetical protein